MSLLNHLAIFPFNILLENSKEKQDIQTKLRGKLQYSCNKVAQIKEKMRSQVSEIILKNNYQHRERTKKLVFNKLAQF